MRSRRQNRNRRQGFTLIEIMVVVVILGILAAAVAPKIIGRTDDAKVARAKNDVATLSSQLEQFYLDMGRYPTTEEGLQLLITAPENEETGGNWKGPYLRKKVTTDPWGNEFFYESPGSVNTDSYDLTSFGADGEEGGGEDSAYDKDIRHWTDEDDELGSEGLSV